MNRAMVVRIGKGIGGPLIGRLIGAGVDVVAYSGSRRKLSSLEEAFAHSPHLRTVRGDAADPEALGAAAADGVDVIFCGIYLTYDEHADKVRRMLEAVDGVSAKTGAKVVLIEGVYRPAGEYGQPPRSDPRYMRLISPELYGADVPNTIIHYLLKKIAQGKPVESIAGPARRPYLYAADAARDAAELASQESSFGKTWRLRGGPAVAEEELVGIAGSVVPAIPRVERIDGWKLKLLRGYKPEAKKMLERYRREDGGSGEPGPEYAGSGAVTSYEEGIAATMKGMKAKK